MAAVKPKPTEPGVETFLDRVARTLGELVAGPVRRTQAQHR